MDSSGHSIIWTYLGFILLVSSPSAIFAFFMNHRKKSLLGLYAPIVFTLFMILMLIFNLEGSESAALGATFIMFLFGFPLIIGALVYTLIRLCFVYRKNLRKGLLIFLSYILGPLLIGLLGLCVVMTFQIHQFVLIVIILMILVSYLPPLYLYHFERGQ